MSNVTGDAPCLSCNWHNYNIQLTGKIEVVSDGYFYECVDGQACERCGEKFTRLHVPFAAALIIHGIIHDAEVI